MSTEYDDFLNELKTQQLDEKKAYGEYKSLAMEAHGLGLQADMEQQLRSIAEDEGRHDRALESMITEVEGLTSRQQPPSGPRAFPSSVEDWQRLASDITARDPTLSRTVEDAMMEIRNGTSYAEGSKRQLTSLAGQLGIK